MLQRRRARIALAAFIALIAAALLMAVATADADAKKKKRKKDKRAPYVTRSVTVDTDGNGKVDAVKLTYSEKVRIAKIKKGKGKAKRKNRKKKPWRTARVLRSAKVVQGKSVLLRMAEGDVADSAERPTIRYVRVPKGAKGVVDRAGNQALSAKIVAADGLAPVPLSAEAFDGDGDGRIDTVRLAYNENVKDPVASQFIVAGHAVTGASASGNVVDISVSTASVGTDSQPAVAATSGAVKDLAGNDQAFEFSTTAIDRAAPVVIDAVTADTNANGRIDRVTVKFSEVISHALEYGPGAVTAVGMNTVSVSEAAVDTVVVEVNDSGGGFATHLKPDVVTAATANPVRDANGNTTGASSFKSTRDGAPPVLVSARSRDGDGDGKLDAIQTTFSEPVLFTTGATSPFSSTEAELGTFAASATAAGSIVTAVLNEDGPSNYNGQLSGFPVTYSASPDEGAVDGAGNWAADATVNATDGAGPAITYAETVDDSPIDGRIDGIKVGFSEPVTTVVGNPFKIASGLRIIVHDPDSSTDVEKITGGSPGDSLYGGVSIPLHALTIDGTIDGPLADPDGHDKPTVDYATVSSGGTRTDYAVDAQGNEVIATGNDAFTGTLDRVKPILKSMQAADSNGDGYVDRLNSTWSEPISTDGTPSFATLSPVNSPLSGYTPPTVAAGATTNGPALAVNLNPASLPDRDIFFSTQYQPSDPDDAGVTDIAGNPAATSPATPLETAALCNDGDERYSLGQDDQPAYADPAPLATAGEDALGTLCGADRDYFSFSASAGETVKVLLSISSAALAQRTGNSYNPFDAEGPGGAIPVSSVFDDAVGWTGTFTAPDAGTYRIGIGDSLLPVLDYGYCVSRTDDGSQPSCTLSQGDFIITEMLNDVGDLAPDVGPYVELKNVSNADRTLESGHVLNVTGGDCPLDPYPGTSLTIPAGGTMYVTTVDDPTKTNDFECAALVAGFDLGQPIAFKTASGVVDSVDFSGVTPPTSHSIQLRAGAAYENSSANDDLGSSWCVSLNAYGTWGAPNNGCDEFRISEIRFLPNSSARDGQVYIELKGSGAVTQASSMLAGWRIRVKPKGLNGAFFQLPETATPTLHGVFVLADSPASGETQVPLFSVQSRDVAAGDTATVGAVGGRTLDSYLRADRPVTVKLLPPAAGDPFACEGPAMDTVGYKPNNVGEGPLATPADDDGLCGVPFLGQQFMPPPIGYQAEDSIQRDNGFEFQNNNNIDYCSTLASPLQMNFTCFGEV